VSARTGRRAGESGTKDAILEAARSRFAEYGYEAATIRGIAADARVDPALVHHFYGTKERLFVAAMRFPTVPSDMLREIAGFNRQQLGELVVRTALGLWEDPRARAPALGLLRSAMTNEGAARMLREFVSDTILSLVAGVAEPTNAQLRASLVASQIVGLGIARYVLELEPIASAAVDELVAAIGPNIQRYLVGDLTGAPLQLPGRSQRT
jgi:AcrR family transcriptional regulator